jgi:K+-sensing histidine kinase KdpD
MRLLAQLLEKWAVLCSVALSIFVLWMDYITGPYVSFPIMFIFPVAMLAWFRPCRWAILLAAMLSAIRLSISVHWLSETKIDFVLILVNTLIRMSVLFIVALLIARIVKQQQALESKVRTLEGFLPVCGFCKKIRNEKDQWEKMEAFISRHSEAQFSHSVCPDCGREHYPEFCPEEKDVAVTAPLK